MAAPCFQEEEMWTKVKRIKSVFPYLFFIYISLFVFCSQIGGDELWNYNFARNICEGGTPYVDFSILQTPLSAYISAFFLAVFGKKLIVFRVMSAILLVSTASMLYKICVKISKEKNLAFILTIIIESLSLIVWIYNYNNLIVFLVLVIFYLDLIKIEKNIKNDIFIGLIIGCCVLIKQSTGGLLLVANIVICIYDIVFEKKDKLRVWVRLGTSMIPGVLFIIYLLITGSLWAIWDYAVRGVGEFKHLYTILELMESTSFGMILGIFPFMVIVLSSLSIFRNTSNISRRDHIMVLVFCILGGIVAYPLTDFSHLLAACVPYVICFVCCLNYKMSKLGNILGVAEAIFLGLIITYAMVPDSEKYVISNLKYFQGIPIHIELAEAIEEVDNYIISKDAENVNVLIADDSAVAYMIPLGRYNKDFDMLLVGNLGSQTIDDLLNQDEKTIYLVRRDETDMGAQNHFELIHKIKNTYIKIGEVQHFDAYIKAK